MSADAPHFSGRRTVVLVSPQFPPSTLAAVHRVRHLAKHLPAHGWSPIVVRVDERHYTETLDPALATLVAAGVRQVRTGALPGGVLRRLGVGDLGLRGYPYLKQALQRIAQDERPDAIFFTGFPFYQMLLARNLKARHRLPIVLDFQDPWVSAFGASRPAWSKEGLSHRIGVVLEPRALRAADFVTSVSETQNAQLAARYPWLDRARMAAIPIGGDPEDFDALRRLRLPQGAVQLDHSAINLSYVGTFLPRAEPLVRQVFAAVAGLRTRNPDLSRRLKLNFVGTSNNPDGARDFRVLPLANDAGIEDLVHEVPQRVPFLEALQLLAKSDGLLLIGSDEPHYTASKIYPALMSGRPYLSLFHAASSAHAVLTAAGGGRALAFHNAGALAALGGELENAVFALAAAPQSLGRVDPAAYAPYTANRVAARFAVVFDALAGVRRAATGLEATAPESAPVV
jgi:hypothetical protein